MFTSTFLLKPILQKEHDKMIQQGNTIFYPLCSCNCHIMSFWLQRMTHAIAPHITLTNGGNSHTHTPTHTNTKGGFLLLSSLNSRMPPYHMLQTDEVWDRLWERKRQSKEWSNENGFSLNVLSERGKKTEKRRKSAGGKTDRKDQRSVVHACGCV